MSAEEIIASICPLPGSSMQRLAAQMTELSCPKGTCLLRAGKVERSVFFVRKGIVRAYLEDEGRQITFWIGAEGSTVVSLKSYVHGQPGYESAECMEDCSFYVLRRAALEDLFREDIEIANWGRKFAESELLKAEEKFIPLLFTTASERYEALLKNSPELLQRLPLECLASYLGVTAQSLSRIRAGLKQGSGD